MPSVAGTRHRGVRGREDRNPQGLRLPLGGVRGEGRSGAQGREGRAERFGGKGEEGSGREVRRREGEARGSGEGHRRFGLRDRELTNLPSSATLRRVALRSSPSSTCPSTPRLPNRGAAPRSGR